MRKLIGVYILLISFFLFLEIRGVSVSLHRKDTLYPHSGNQELKFFYELMPYKKQMGWFPYEPIQTINTDDLNERFDYSISKRNGIYRIITLGGSTTFGLFVDTKDNWTEQLEELLNNRLSCSNSNIRAFEVINLAVHGYDIDYEVERFRNRGVKYHPDLVVWFLSDEATSQINEIVLPRDSFYLLNKQSISSDNRLIHETAWKKAITDMKYTLGENVILKLQRYSMERINDYYKGPMLIVSVYQSSLYESLLHTFSSVRPKTYFYRYPEKLDTIEGLIFSENQFPTSKGHEVIAKDIFHYIIDQGIILCREM